MLYKGCTGVVERHGGVKIGDVLIKVGDKDVTEMPYKDAIEYLNSLSNKTRKLLFQDSRAYYRARRLSLSGNAHAGVELAAGMISNSVACAVVDTRIVRENGRPQYAEYQVSVAAPSRYELGTPIKRWKTWKRYSEFYTLDQALRKQLGWKLQDVKFPPKRTFFNLDENFIQSRRESLDEYLCKVLAIRGVSDFHLHTSSSDLKNFLEYDAYIVEPTQGAQQQQYDDDQSRTNESNSKGCLDPRALQKTSMHRRRYTRRK
mmetsp:Transcript_35652/g.44214  ORF Transcript_35652/g.44214 Transcript_35652/m.44214 type:complete len:260 (+) Transcript_35652:726-1505(+)